jgi:hypothetical protein
MDPIIAVLLSYPAITPQEYMQVLRTSRSSTYKGVRNKSIPSFRQGKTVMIPTSFLKEKLGLTQAA